MRGASAESAPHQINADQMQARRFGSYALGGIGRLGAARPDGGAGGRQRPAAPAAPRATRCSPGLCWRVLARPSASPPTRALGSRAALSTGSLGSIDDDVVATAEQQPGTPRARKLQPQPRRQVREPRSIRNAAPGLSVTSSWLLLVRGGSIRRGGVLSAEFEFNLRPPTRPPCCTLPARPALPPCPPTLPPPTPSTPAQRPAQELPPLTIRQLQRLTQLHHEDTYTCGVVGSVAELATRLHTSLCDGLRSNQARPTRRGGQLASQPPCSTPAGPQQHPCSPHVVPQQHHHCPQGERAG